jgi:hypothetical protein|tara:strand:- start:197 stop:607 length:411 start_codon:yes stop_codon:yes gene_type:complete
MASPSYETARTRKLQVETALAEMELSKARREYVSASDVQHVWADVFANMKSKLLSMPTILAPMLVDQKDASQIKEIIDRSVVDCLEELTSYDPKIEVAPDDGGSDEGSGAERDSNPKATAKTNRKRVGRPRKASIV